MLPPLLGTSPAMRMLRKLIPELARSDEPLLIVGESGVGKTLLAQHIHARGKLARSQLRTLDISAMTDRDQRIDLLGVVPPEDTSTRRGILELPGTALIKNIDHAASYLQESVAKAVKSRSVNRWGSPQSVPLLARSVFTVHRSPSELHSAGRLVEPLFSLLQALHTIIVPPLRERKQDILALCGCYRQGVDNSCDAECRQRRSKLILRVAREAAWAGNVRELKAFLRSVSLLSPEEAIRAHELTELNKMIMMIEEGAHFSLGNGLSSIQFDLIERAIRKSNGKQKQAARLLGISDRTMRDYASKIVQL
jgi:two-component system response regulator AtoC